MAEPRSRQRARGRNAFFGPMLLVAGLVVIAAIALQDVVAARLGALLGELWVSAMDTLLRIVTSVFGA